MENNRSDSGLFRVAARICALFQTSLLHSWTFAALAMVWGSLEVDCYALTVFETASLGTTGLTSNLGVGVYNDQFIGVRFEVQSTVTTTTIGGHFGTVSSVGNNKFFGAIVALTDAGDFPNSPDLSTPDILGTTLLEFPNPSAEISAPLSVTLNPGHFALIFGTGLFGATGNGGGVPPNNDPLGPVSWISYNPPPEGWRSLNFDGVRFFVTGVPEPSTGVLIAIGAIGALSLHRARRSMVTPRKFPSSICQTSGLARLASKYLMTALPLFSTSVCCANAELVYSASPPNHQFNGGVTFFAEEIGNQVSLAAGGRNLATIGIVVTSQNEDITADLKFRFYANDGAGGAPGSLLGESQEFIGIQIASGAYHGVGTAVFVSDILLPDAFTWTVEMTNPIPVVIGLPHLTPPAYVGQSVAAWSGSPSVGWTKLEHTPLFDAYIFATPEPSCGLLVAVGGIVGSLCRTTRRRAPGSAIRTTLLPIRGPALGAASVVLLALTTFDANANFLGSDEFSVPLAAWGSDSASGTAQFQLQEGRLNFVTNASPTENDTVQRSWIANTGDYSADWSLRIDVALGDFTMNSDQFASVDLLVENLGDVSNDFVRVILRRDGITSRNFYADAFSNGQFVLDAVFVPTLSVSASLGLSYDAATHTITAGYDSDGQTNGYLFYPILDVPIASGESTWNMMPTDGFRVRIIGQTAQLNISLGHLTIDNFAAAEERLATVPEPASILSVVLALTYLFGLKRQI